MNPDLEDGLGHSFRAVRLHFNPVGVVGEHHQEVPGGEDQLVLPLAPVGVEVVGLRPVELSQLRRGRDLHPLAALQHQVDVQIVFVGLEEALLLGNRLVGEAGDVHVAALEFLPLTAHAGEEPVIDPLQGHVQVGVDAPIAQGVAVFRVNHTNLHRAVTILFFMSVNQ